MPRDISLADMSALIYSVADYYGIARKDSDGSYHCACPLHGGKDSLHISATDKVLVYCFGDKGECGQEALKEKIAIDGFDIDVICREALATGKKGKKADRVQNIPAHDQTPLDLKVLSIYNDGTSYPVTQAYPYVEAQGKVIFYVLRANTTEPKTKGSGFVKHVRPYSSFRTEDGQSFWDYGLAMEAKRPLYNLKDITDRPEAPVLLVEGEKTADAAKRQFPDWVVTTYAFGMANYTKTDFTPLKGRAVTLWPDNSEAGIKNFLNVAALIDPRPKIVMSVPLSDRPENWDLADEVGQEMFSSQSLLERAQPAAVSKVSPEGFDAAAAKYNEFLRVLKIGGTTWVYDIRKRIDDPWLAYDYTSFSDITRVYSERIINPLAGKRSDPFMFAVKAWELDEKKQLVYGIAYDPATTDEIVLNRGSLPYVNKFMGFDCAAKACDPARYLCFENHIRHIMDKQSADYMMSFFAHIIQRPKQKPGVLPILIGGQATGKTIIGKIIRAMLGYRNVYICDGRTFNSKWSGQFSGKLLIVVNEYTTDKQDQDFMNTFITDNFLTLEHKGKPIVSEESFHRVIGTTNSTHFQLSLDDRRYFPIKINNPSIDSSAKTETNKAYFNDLDRLEIDEEGLSGLHDYLANYKMLVDVQLVPQTQYRYEGMKPVNPVHAIILEICESGSLPEEFGLIYQETQVLPNTPQYPSKVLRKHLRTMVKVMTKLDGPKVTHMLMEFLAPKQLSKDSNITMKFVRHGRPKDSPEVDNDRVFELPPLADLRKLYNELVDPKRQWGPIPLRVVKDADNDDDSPI